MLCSRRTSCCVPQALSSASRKPRARVSASCTGRVPHRCLHRCHAASDDSVPLPEDRGGALAAWLRRWPRGRVMVATVAGAVVLALVALWSALSSGSAPSLDCCGSFVNPWEALRASIDASKPWFQYKLNKVCTPGLLRFTAAHPAHLPRSRQQALMNYVLLFCGHALSL